MILIFPDRDNFNFTIFRWNMVYTFLIKLLGSQIFIVLNLFKCSKKKTIFKFAKNNSNYIIRTLLFVFENFIKQIIESNSVWNGLLQYDNYDYWGKGVGVLTQWRFMINLTIFDVSKFQRIGISFRLGNIFKSFTNVNVKVE